jgi:hypothetical protein
VQSIGHIKERQGRCFEPGRLMRDEPGADAFTLVHGGVYKDPVWLDFRYIRHAWIELPDGSRYDAVLDESKQGRGSLTLVALLGFWPSQVGD